MMMVEQPPPATGKHNTHEQKYYRWATPIAIFAFIISCVSATFTAVQVCLMYNNNVVTQRPNITINEISLYNSPDGVGVIPKWENVGNANAQVSARVNWLFTRDPPPENFFLVEGNPAGIPHSIGPKGSDSATFAAISHVCFENWRQHIFRYVTVWGAAKYFDQISKKQRVTRFCWNIIGLFNKPSGEPERFVHNFCERGNCIDEACDEYDKLQPPRLAQDLKWEQVRGQFWHTGKPSQRRACCLAGQERHIIGLHRCSVHATVLIRTASSARGPYVFQTCRLTTCASSRNAIPFKLSATSFPRLSASGCPVFQVAASRFFADQLAGAVHVARICISTGPSIGRIVPIWDAHSALTWAIAPRCLAGVKRTPDLLPARAHGVGTPGTTK